MGDTRTHVFRIITLAQGYIDLFSQTGAVISKEASGRAAVTVDFVRIRCHIGIGNAFRLTIDAAASIAKDLHDIE